MSAIHRLARHAGRPILMSPLAATELAERARTWSPDMRRASRAWWQEPGRALSKVLAPPQPKAWDDDDYEPTPAHLKRPAAYRPRWAPEPTAEGEWGWSLIEGVACLEVDSALMERGASFCGAWWHGYDSIACAVREAASDARVRAIFTRMESPGGVVHGNLEACAAEIRAARASAGGKPIWVYADLAASAAYWLASQADVIAAPAVGLIGSIGAVIVHEDWSEAIAKAGVRVTAIQFGAKKTDGAEWKPLSEDAVADLQAEIDELGARFVAGVIMGRPALTREGVLETQAGVYLAHSEDAARSALSRGLIDRVEASEEAAFRALQASLETTQPQSVAPRAAAQAKKPISAASNRKGAVMKTGITRATAMTADEYLQEVQRILDGEGSSDDKAAAIDALDLDAAEEEGAEASEGEATALSARVKAAEDKAAAAERKAEAAIKLMMIPDPKLGPAPTPAGASVDATDATSAFILSSGKRLRGAA